MDWGLFRKANLGGQYPDERGSTCCGAPPTVCAMREPRLITRSKLVYVLLCVFDLLLRFVWALAVFGGVPSRGAGMLFFECVEVLRRTVWAVRRPRSNRRKLFVGPIACLLFLPACMLAC